jgi:hypothetical protein
MKDRQYQSQKLELLALCINYSTLELYEENMPFEYSKTGSIKIRELFVGRRGTEYGKDKYTPISKVDNYELIVFGKEHKMLFINEIPNHSKAKSIYLQNCLERSTNALISFKETVLKTEQRIEHIKNLLNIKQ